MNIPQEIATPLDILMVTKNGMLHKGRKLSSQEVESLKSQALTIQSTELWKMLISEGKYHAQKRATIDTDIDDDKKSLVILRKAQAFHRVVVLFETFMSNINKS